MTKDFGEVREYLRREYERLAEQSALELSHTFPERQEGTFRGEQELAAHMSELERRFASVRRTRAQLAEVEHALDKLEKGTYGLCDSCGRAITPARLEAIPQANLCVQCKAHQIGNRLRQVASGA